MLLDILLGNNYNSDSSSDISFDVSDSDDSDDSSDENGDNENDITRPQPALLKKIRLVVSHALKGEFNIDAKKEMISLQITSNSFDHISLFLYHANWN